MTVSTEVNHEQYDGNGTTTVFPFRFRILKSSHMVVTVSDPDAVLSTLLLGTDYTLNGVGQINGGTVVLAKPLALGWRMSLDRSLPAVQETDLRNQGRFFAETHEDAFDYLTMLIQQALSVFGLGLKKPSWVADFYDALGNRISNLGAPKSGGDATNKSYVDTQNLKNIRVPENTVAATPALADRQNKLFAWDNQGNPIAVIPQDGSASDVLIELQKPTGSNLIKVPTGETLTSYLSTGRGIDPRMPPYNYRENDSTEKRTAALQNAFNDANNTKKWIYLTGFFKCEKIVLDGHKDYSVMGYGGFIFENTSGYGFEMKNCSNINISNGLSINATRTVAVKVWGNESKGGTSLLNLGFTIIGAARAWEFGDDSEPDCLVSEIVVRGGYTYNCGEVYYAIGSQVVIEFNSYQMIAGGDSTPVGPSGQIRVGTNVGAVTHINGGEVMKPTSTDGGMFTSRPINSVQYEKAYGSVYINGSAIESASPWFVAVNPLPGKVSDITPGTGAFVINACHGYYGQNSIPIQITDFFTGQLRVKSSRFHRKSGLNLPIVISNGGAYPVCDIDDSCFDNYFPKGFSKYNGTCMPYFNYRRIGMVSNLNNQSISGSGNQTDLKFQNIDSSSLADNSLFIDNYVKSSGVFTVPKGGLNNVCLYVQWDVGAAHANSTLFVMTNLTTPVAQINGDMRLVNGFVQLGNLSEGTAISLRFQNGGSAFNCFSKNDDYFAVFASR
ncbi:hypothetical protein KFO32_16510 [Pantoea ananatis]|uniref:hypothetical protein n=1 Tax=Pantoea ananas TaxID=553 RepID=UPI001FF5FC38|nr:hypothetical protein [Pantoea ananatis]MCK0554644.1 hypothetical protein [Pantoea ananatis]